MRTAWHLGTLALPAHSSRFSRKDFTLPQLFACLVLREHQRKSYRGLEALLRDARHWCRAIGMKRVPDHNTLCRAFHCILGQYTVDRMLDLLGQWARLAQQLGHILAIDSSLYDTHHRSRHYEQRCRHQSSADPAEVSERRSQSCRRTPKLTVALDTRSHLILAAKARTGMGSDCRDFEPVARDACRRGRVQQILADAGYDSEANHRVARRDLGVESLIKAGIGKPTTRPPASLWRRLMAAKLKGSQKGQPYGQRSQVETGNSMMKRNLGDALRARSDDARQLEQLLRVLTHNVMLVLRWVLSVETEPVRPLQTSSPSDVCNLARASEVLMWNVTFCCCTVIRG